MSGFDEKMLEIWRQVRKTDNTTRSEASGIWNEINQSTTFEDKLQALSLIGVEKHPKKFVFPVHQDTGLFEQPENPSKQKEEDRANELTL